MDHHGRITLKGGSVVENLRINESIDWPDDPAPGKFLFRNRTVFICVEIADGLPVWVPITPQLEMVQFNQDTPAMEWVINHNLGSGRVLVQLFDINGKTIGADEVTQTFNQVVVSYSMPVAGCAVLQRGNMSGEAQDTIRYENTYTNSDTWTINHQLGFNPIVNCYIGGKLVQPLDTQFPTLNTAVVTWSTPRTGVAQCV